VENESQRSNDSTIDEHFIAIDHDVFVFSPLIGPKQNADDFF
jgi:hypothetical protein